MAGSAKAKGGANKLKRVGSRKNQIARYYEKRFPLKKLRNLLKFNGVNDARSWADKHGALHILPGLTGRVRRHVHKKALSA